MITTQSPAVVFFFPSPSKKQGFSKTEGHKDLTGWVQLQVIYTLNKSQHNTQVNWPIKLEYQSLHIYDQDYHHGK